MHSTLMGMILPLLLNLPTSAKTMSLEDFYSLSKAGQERLGKTPTFEKKSAALLDLERSFKATLEEYKELHPKVGAEQEHKVAELYYILEPAFTLAKTKKISTRVCLKAKQEVTVNDRRGREENAAFSKNAEEALTWIRLFCD